MGRATRIRNAGCTVALLFGLGVVVGGHLLGVPRALTGVVAVLLAVAIVALAERATKR